MLCYKVKFAKHLGKICSTQIIQVLFHKEFVKKFTLIFTKDF